MCKVLQFKKQEPVIELTDFEARVARWLELIDEIENEEDKDRVATFISQEILSGNF